MRLFTGIALPAEVTDNLERLVRGLKPHAKIRWSPVANLHITTKFIGEWPQDRLEELQDALGGLERRGAFTVAVRGFEWYPNERSARVFCTRIEGPEPLYELARRTGQALEELGVPPEKRRYSPHLTLARIKKPAGLGRLRDAVENLPSSEFGEFTVESFHLYLSEPQPGGSVYTSLATYPV